MGNTETEHCRVGVCTARREMRGISAIWKHGVSDEMQGALMATNQHQSSFRNELLLSDELPSVEMSIVNRLHLFWSCVVSI